MIYILVHCTQIRQDLMLSQRRPGALFQGLKTYAMAVSDALSSVCTWDRNTATARSFQMCDCTQASRSPGDAA